MNPLLVIDDDPFIRELVSTLLRNEAFEVIEATDGREGLERLGEGKIDLCVVDIMMPRMDGFDFCKYARKYYEDMPILMLTAKGETAAKVKGFELGADDYLVKPFDGAELIARVRSLLKRYKITTSHTITVGELSMDDSGHTARLAGEPIEMPLKEFELLFLLASRPGKTYSRSALIEEVWGFDFDGNERTLDVHINRLRNRFSEETARIKIATIRGLGYRLEELA
jgi:DNA-binding response OmpR family regulator